MPWAEVGEAAGEMSAKARLVRALGLVPDKQMNKGLLNSSALHWAFFLSLA
jgi:hypothetical protein